MIAFKQAASIDEWGSLHPTLRRILLWLSTNWPDDYMEITRIYNPPVVGETGVHRTRPHRAADARTNDMTPEQGEAIVALVNSTWRYNFADSPKVALQHGDGDNRHLHLQVSASGQTRRRSESSVEIA